LKAARVELVPFPVYLLRAMKVRPRLFFATRQLRARTPPSVISPALLPVCDSQVGQVATHPQATNSRPTAGMVSGASRGAGREPKEGRMLQSSENSFLKSGSPASNPNTFNPVKTVTAPVDQATIGRTLVIKGEITGSEALYIDGRIE